jgi:hypothetical protein
MALRTFCSGPACSYQVILAQSGTDKLFQLTNALAASGSLRIGIFLGPQSLSIAYDTECSAPASYISSCSTVSHIAKPVATNACSDSLR